MPEETKKHIEAAEKESANNNEADRYSVVIRVLTWLFRLIVGGVFIFSGFVKGIDPWGTYYKFEEYFAAMGLPMAHSILLTGVFALCALEFLTGVCILLGCYRRSSPIVALGIMCVMLPLTIWIAVANPISDCGCFGDYLVLSNDATMWKNVLLTAMIVWLLKFNLKCITIVSPAFQWIAVVITIAFIIVVSSVGYFWQPLLDFRPYPLNSTLSIDSEDESDNPQFVFVYQRNGETREFGMDDELPSEEDGWEFVERKEIPSGKDEKPADEQTFRIWDRSGDEDVTESAIDSEGKTLMLMIPDLSKVSPATTWKINALYEWANRVGAEMIAVVAGTSQEISNWEDLSMPEYEIYTADDTAIKEVVRGNPAIVILDKNRIQLKSALVTLDVDEMTEQGERYEPSVIIADGQATMASLFWLYLICMAFPVTLSFMPRIKDAYTTHRQKKQTKRDSHL